MDGVTRLSHCGPFHNLAMVIIDLLVLFFFNLFLEQKGHNLKFVTGSVISLDNVKIMGKVH